MRCLRLAHHHWLFGQMREYQRNNMSILVHHQRDTSIILLYPTGYIAPLLANMARSF